MFPDSTLPTGAAFTDAVDDEPRTAPHAEPAHQVITASERMCLAGLRSRPRRRCASGIALVGVALLDHDSGAPGS